MDQALILFRDSMLGIITKVLHCMVPVMLVAVAIWAILQIRKEYKYWMG